MTKKLTYDPAYAADRVIAKLIGTGTPVPRIGWDDQPLPVARYDLEAGFADDPRYVEAYVGGYVQMAHCVDDLAPAAEVVPADAATVKSRATCARPASAELPAWLRRMWQLTVDGVRYERPVYPLHKTKREALVAAAVTIAVIDWQIAVRSKLAEFDEAGMLAAESLAAGWTGTTAELLTMAGTISAPARAVA